MALDFYGSAAPQSSTGDPDPNAGTVDQIGYVQPTYTPVSVETNLPSPWWPNPHPDPSYQVPGYAALPPQIDYKLLAKEIVKEMRKYGYEGR